MDNYLIKVEIQDGENEYNNAVIVKEKNGKDLPVEKSKINNYFNIDNFTRLLSIKSIEAITEEEVKTIKKFGFAYYL